MEDELTWDRPLLRHRLPLSAYIETGRAWHVTLGTFDRTTSPFADATVALDIMDAISGRAAYYSAVLHLCCLMPDHVHLLVEIMDKGLIDVVRDLKSVSTRTWWECGGSGKLWQRSFYDRGVRNIDEFENDGDVYPEQPGACRPGGELGSVSVHLWRGHRNPDRSRRPCAGGCFARERGIVSPAMADIHSYGNIAGTGPAPTGMSHWTTRAMLVKLGSVTEHIVGTGPAATASIPTSSRPAIATRVRVPDRGCRCGGRVAIGPTCRSTG